MHLIETFAGRGDAASFTNAVTEIVVAAGARVEHTRIQREAAGASHIASIYATLDRDAQFTARSFALGARLARTETRVVFTAPGGTAVLDGLYVLDGVQHSDNRTSVDHAQPHCTSRQNYKGVLAGASRGVFQGRVVVRPDAQHTDAQQSNRNLILSESALVDTQPQLEILADDVRCTHGATIGRLDDDARFYLQSRGIAAADAERLLTHGFAHEIIDATTPVELRERIAALVDARFAARSEVGGAP
jgi:Fe-S cluster assembly protein SufD